MKKKHVVIISLLGVVILVIGIVIFFMNKVIFSNSRIEILDVAMPDSCNKGLYSFYEDDKYIYSFPCANSERTIYVKFENGNKMLVIDALEAEMVTIEELIKVDKKDKKIIKIQEK